MIPKNICREHILKAIEEIKKVGVPKNRGSKKFLLEFEGEYYPPKYVISLANKYANGRELDSQEFSGGQETNTFLKRLGFKVVEVSSKRPISMKLKEDKEKHSKAHQGERCPRCKEAVKKLLEKIYGKVEENYKFEIGTKPEDFRNIPWYDELRKIYEALQNYKGFKNFVKARTLPRCDFFVENPGFIVEFDESQHFTVPRRISLEMYPDKLKLGFDRKKWVELCKKINAKDNDPPYRDEQRAWYDTLRDFLPKLMGLNPTVRLFAKDYVWCSFDPDNPADVRRFKNILRGVSGGWKIEVREESNPRIARIVIADDWDGNPKRAKQLLQHICERWPKGRKVEFLITCGGFLQFDWPESVPKKGIDVRNPPDEVINEIVSKAKEYLNRVLDRDLCRKLSEVTDYITIGMDSFKEKISTTRNYIGQPHVELVFIKDLKRNKTYWTGKSYPTTAQERGLIRIADIKTHFINLDFGKVMILGCHDLTIFNPRSKNAKGWRREVKEKFEKLAKKEKPIYVLQHPHTTVKVRTWLNAWRGLVRTLPTVRHYASSGRYYEPERKQSEWDILDHVLEHTKSKNTRTIDFIIRLQ